MDNSDILERAAASAEIMVEQVMSKRHGSTTFGTAVLPFSHEQILNLFVWRTDENGDEYYTDEAQELFNRYYSEALEELDNGQ